MTNKENINKEKNNIIDILFKIDKNNYKGDYYDHLLKQYNLYIEMMDRVSSRRIRTNSFFLTANTVLFSAIGVLIKLTQNLGEFNGICIIISAISGIIFSFTWFRLITEFKNLNKGKFKIIHLLETKLPAQLYKAEWEYLQPIESSSRYKLVTEIEKKVPLVFIILYVFMLIVGIIIFFPTIMEFLAIKV